MEIQRFTITPFQQNTRLIACETTKKAIVVDPGETCEEIKTYIETKSYSLQAITLTHGHLDHVGGTHYLKGEFPDAEILIHKDDHELYLNLPLQPLAMGIPAGQLEGLGFKYENPPEITRFWEHGEVYVLGDLAFEIRHCPGHTPGHIVMAENELKKVFVGDCLFQGSIGRTDLPGGSHEQLMKSIEEQILTLGDDFTVYSGHGPETTIGHERQTNPFLTGDYQVPRGRFV